MWTEIIFIVKRDDLNWESVNAKQKIRNIFHYHEEFDGSKIMVPCPVYLDEPVVCPECGEKFPTDGKADKEKEKKVDNYFARKLYIGKYFQHFDLAKTHHIHSDGSEHHCSNNKGVVYCDSCGESFKTSKDLGKKAIYLGKQNLPVINEIQYFLFKAANIWLELKKENGDYQYFYIDHHSEKILDAVRTTEGLVSTNSYQENDGDLFFTVNEKELEHIIQELFNEVSAYKEKVKEGINKEAGKEKKKTLRFNQDQIAVEIMNKSIAENTVSQNSEDNNAPKIPLKAGRHGRKRNTEEFSSDSFKTAVIPINDLSQTGELESMILDETSSAPAEETNEEEAFEVDKPKEDSNSNEETPRQKTSEMPFVVERSSVPLPETEIPRYQAPQEEIPQGPPHISFDSEDEDHTPIPDFYEKGQHRSPFLGQDNSSNDIQELEAKLQKMQDLAQRAEQLIASISAYKTEAESILDISSYRAYLENVFALFSDTMDKLLEDESTRISHYEEIRVDRLERLELMINEADTRISTAEENLIQEKEKSQKEHDELMRKINQNYLDQKARELNAFKVTIKKVLAEIKKVRDFAQKWQSNYFMNFKRQMRKTLRIEIKNAQKAHQKLKKELEAKGKVLEEKGDQKISAIETSGDNKIAKINSTGDRKLDAIKNQVGRLEKQLNLHNGKLLTEQTESQQTFKQHLDIDEEKRIKGLKKTARTEGQKQLQAIRNAGDGEIAAIKKAANTERSILHLGTIIGAAMAALLIGSIILLWIRDNQSSAAHQKKIQKLEKQHQLQIQALNKKMNEQKKLQAEIPKMQTALNEVKTKFKEVKKTEESLKAEQKNIAKKQEELQKLQNFWLDFQKEAKSQWTNFFGKSKKAWEKEEKSRKKHLDAMSDDYNKLRDYYFNKFEKALKKSTKKVISKCAKCPKVENSTDNFFLFYWYKKFWPEKQSPAMKIIFPRRTTDKAKTVPKTVKKRKRQIPRKKTLKKEANKLKTAKTKRKKSLAAGKVLGPDGKVLKVFYYENGKIVERKVK